MSSPGQEGGSGPEMPPLATEANLPHSGPVSPEIPDGQDASTHSEHISNRPPGSSLSPDELVEEPESVNGIFNLLGGRLVGGPMGMMAREPVADSMPEKLKELHPYATTLGFSDLESCLKLEEAAAGPENACTREKLSYHLSTAGELSLGIFTSAEPSSPLYAAPTAETAKSPDSFAPTRKGVLLAQIVSTKTVNPVVEDEDCMMPVKPGQPPTEVSNQRRGHNEAGRTIAVQSLAVLPEYQGRGLGRVLLKAYVQRMAESDIADRIAVLVDPSHVGYYEKMGFTNLGASSAKRANGHQVNMILEFGGSASKYES